MMSRPLKLLFMSFINKLVFVYVELVYLLKTIIIIFSGSYSGKNILHLSNYFYMTGGVLNRKASLKDKWVYKKNNSRGSDPWRSLIIREK